MNLSIPGDRLPGVCHLRFFVIFHGLLFAQGAYSVHINQTASTMMVQLYHRQKEEGMPCEPNALPETSQGPIDR